jgi:hypothetical protein
MSVHAHNRLMFVGNAEKRSKPSTSGKVKENMATNKIQYTENDRDYSDWKASEQVYEHDLMQHIQQHPSGCSDDKCGYCKEYGSRLFESSRDCDLNQTARL